MFDCLPLNYTTETSRIHPHLRLAGPPSSVRAGHRTTPHGTSPFVCCRRESSLRRPPRARHVRSPHFRIVPHETVGCPRKTGPNGPWPASVPQGFPSFEKATTDDSPRRLRRSLACLSGTAPKPPMPSVYAGPHAPGQSDHGD